MVKNQTGGNKQNGQARKYASGNNSSAKLRISEDESEIYSQVTNVLGNGMCHVLGIDNVTRLCIIRGKFRGRNMRDNSLKRGSWVLVGLREWELLKTTSSSGKTEYNKCDLLEVYSQSDVDRLKASVSANWSPFIANDNLMNNISATDSEFKFMDPKEAEYRQLLEQERDNVGAQPIPIGFKPEAAYNAVDFSDI